MKVKTDYVNEQRCGYLTANKEYEVVDGYIVADDSTSIFIIINGCAFLEGRAWEIVEY